MITKKKVKEDLYLAEIIKLQNEISKANYGSSPQSPSSSMKSINMIRPSNSRVKSSFKPAPIPGSCMSEKVA